MHLSTGIPDLDDILEGGYENPSNILIYGPSGIEKELLGFHFISKDPSSFLICANASPQDTINKASNYGLDLSSVNFIDCYSQMLGKEVEPKENIIYVPGPSALNDLSLALNDAMHAGAKKIVFNTLSTFILHSNIDSLTKFLGVVEGRFKKAGITALFLVDSGVHDKQTVNIIESGMDSVYTIKTSNQEVLLSIPGLEIDIPFKLTPAGLVVV